MDRAPIVIVETVGVRNLGLILANASGSALYTAIDSVVLAVGRIVVCVEAAAELRIIKNSNLATKAPNPVVPNTEPPSTDSTSNVWAGFWRPIPFVPMPEIDWAARMTIT